MLRPVEDRDIAPLIKIMLHPEIALWWMEYDEEKLRRELLEEAETRSFAIGLQGLLIGVIMYTEENDPDYKFAMIDVTVDADHVGQGLGTDALRTVARYLIEERGHHHLMIDPAAANKRAIAAYKKVGFKPVGIMREYERGPGGQWRDSLLMDLLARELT